MGTVKLGTDDIRYITIFENMTGAVVKDCLIESDNRVVFVVKQGDIGLAIGRGGATIQRVRNLICRDIEVVEHASDPSMFIKNVLKPAEVRRVHITTRKDGKRIALIDVDEKDRGLAIGKGGRNIQRAKILAKRHHEIEDVIIV